MEIKKTTTNNLVFFFFCFSFSSSFSSRERNHPFRLIYFDSIALQTGVSYENWDVHAHIVSIGSFKVLFLFLFFSFSSL